MKIEDMTKEERSLLLYLETRYVDHAGLVDGKHLNDIVKEWPKEKGRVGTPATFLFESLADKQVFTSKGTVTPETFEANAEDVANAHRIVACVNALPGFSTPDLEAGIIGEMVELLKEVNNEKEDAYLTFYTGGKINALLLKIKEPK